MTRRRFLKRLLAGPISAGLCVCGPVAAPAQSQRQAADDTRRERPQNNATLQVKKLSPELEAVLRNWEKATGRVQTLQGKHHRFIYDEVFEVEKRADGIFYYRAPDKGRIDISAVKITADKKSGKTGKGGKPFKLQSDRPERWVCDGKQILQVNDTQKTVEQFPIPPQAQGQNIMEGPLPFLFGMPADKAKRRYFLKLLKITETQVLLEVKPRWRQDAANWREAKVILQKRNYLPSAVQLTDPAGNLVTVYTFSDLKVNQKPLLPWQGDPFNPRLIGYKWIKSDSRVPSVVGEDYEKAQEVLEAAGYSVKFRRGKPARTRESVFAVYQQEPNPATPLAKGKTVYLTCYDRMVQQTSDKRP